MSDKERAIQLLDQIPESKMYYIIGILEGVAIPDETPNAETLATMQELESGGGEVFSGSTDDFFKMLLEEN
ncbi:MAG: hypothetical protein HFH62_11160 [Lachnospiraceae bacterium]|nr:hypothetical protein [Lachnospiraceae bacterium]